MMRDLILVVDHHPNSSILKLKGKQYYHVIAHGWGVEEIIMMDKTEL